MSRTDWMQNYPGVAKLLQQEEDVLEGLSQEEGMPAAVPLPSWRRQQHHGEQGRRGSTTTVWLSTTNRALGI